MEDEEWEDVLLCSYLTSPDKLGPKHFSDAQFNKLLETKVWAEPVSENDNNEGSALLHLIKSSFEAAKKLTENKPDRAELDLAAHLAMQRTNFLCRTKRPGFLFMFSWGNTVVHAKKNGEISMLDDKSAKNKCVQFILEHFDHLFVFRDYDHPRIYKEGVLVAELKPSFENFTSKGVCGAADFVYYSEKSTHDLVKVARDFSHSIVPGTERTSDFVVLKDERLFWITKSCILSNSEKSINLAKNLGLPVTFRSMMVVTRCDNVLLWIGNKHFLLVSPELEIIDSVLNQTFDKGFHMRANRNFTNMTLVLLDTGKTVLGIAVRKNRIYPLSNVQAIPSINSISPLDGFWIVAGYSFAAVLRLAF